MNMPPEIWYGVAALALLLGLIYGWVRYATRDRRRDRITESATRILYNTPTRDDVSEPAAPDEFAKKHEERRSAPPR